ncbi:type 1 glutamine amidotransferase domain-containing protein [Nocardioides marmotae]|uniref:type 1 glutamine amidotransferase domain-containing protein n=1 Tax=Nocardioides marmotae TaxID=2663857 RepID=UPI001324026F|nr:type 1 glutamine amidotransferase domain-containing protein [Nocardioides marmotae]MBC9731629.1 type 1 glutamine amidotransferase [Nocardioides marmotae]MTB82751.1 DJ-1/PfpI/YhbO family deglycase/protease [Nocardioides marmotae]
MAEQSVSGTTIAFLVSTEGIEQAELTGPWEAVKEAGGTPVLLSTETGEVQAFNHLDKADTFAVDKVVDGVSVEDFDGLVLPGGAPNGDLLRTSESAVSFVRDLVGSGKPTAVICHAPWVLVEADVVRGRRLTSWPSLQTDIRNAGGTWVDEEVVVDGNLVTSRQPDDLPAFNRELLTLVAQRP